MALKKKKSTLKPKSQKKVGTQKNAKPSPKVAKKEKELPPASLSQTDPTALEIIRRIRATFSPTFMKLENQSARHAKHKGKGSGSHYELKIVSDLFNGLSLLQRSHWVNSVFQDLYGKAVHALKLDLKSPQETPLPEYKPEPMARQTKSKKR